MSASFVYTPVVLPPSTHSVGSTPTAADSGAVGVFIATTISGWAFSPANDAAPVNVIITIDGVPTTVLANGNRPDLVSKLGSADHGFSFTMPGLSTGTHSVTVAMVDPTTSAQTILKSGVITIAPVTGLVATLTASTVTGWAYSAANSAAPVSVVITIDGTPTTITANGNRPDLVAKLGTADHGFSFTMPGLGTGTHSVTVEVLDPTTGVATLLKSATITIAKPVGTVAVLTSKTVSGYAFSAANQAAPVSVVITIDGVPTTITANGNRPDLVATLGSADHGYSFTMPGLATGTHTVSVSVLDPTTGAATLLKSGTVTIAPPVGLVEVLNSKTISGYAFSAADNNAAVSIVITIDGNATTITANGTRNDLAAKLGSATVGFSYSVPGLATGTHTVSVSMIDPSNGTVTLLKSGSIVIAPPTGLVEVLSSKTISGYAISAADNYATVNVVITIDGNATTVAANGSRPDLQTKLGASSIGFSYSVPGLATGTHTVTVDLVDPSNGNLTRIKTGTIVIAPPVGKVEVATSNTISGYAFSAADSAAPVEVVITLNGHAVTVTANGNRPDLVKTLGSANHGFIYAVPALSTGVNTVTVDILDLSTGHLTRILSSTIKVGPPVGVVSVFTASTISGWALNPADGAAPVNVAITINGVATTVNANQYLSSLTATYGSAYHGFSFTVPTLAVGTSTVTVQLVDPYTGQTLLLKSGVLTNAPPIGAVTLSTATEIAGYATDAGMTGSLQVRIDVNGVAGTPFLANNSNKIANGMNVGFDVTGDYTGKVVEVYAYDSQTNTPVLIWTNNHPPKGAITTATGFVVTGWAVDPDSPNTPVTVEVKIDGVVLTAAVANIARPDVQATAGALNVGFSVNIPGLTPGTHTISVYAIDEQANSQAPVLLGSKIVTDAPPVGLVQTINSNVVQGYALDPDLGTNPATVNVYVDEKLFATVQANGTNTAKPGHGFSVDLSSLPAGSHAITVTVMDDRTSDEQEVVIYDDFINNHQPIGAIESISGTTITGWAQDPDTATGAIPVDIYVDGKYAETVEANGNRPDLVATLGSANHGFTATLPALSFGSHQITAYASESQGNVSSLIGTMTVVNNRPDGAVEVANATTVSGWAQDPDRPTESVAVEVFVNGIEVASGTANQTRNDLTASLGSANHGYSISLPTLSLGTNTINVYAVDLNNGLISLIGSSTVTI